MNGAYVYRHIRIDKNVPFYIGIGEDDNYKRAYSKKDRNKYWKNIINKTPYEVEIILDELSKDESKIKEIEFIKLHGRKDLGLGTLVNMTDGGEGLCNPSDETRKKIGMGKGFANKRHSEETKSLMRSSNKRLNLGKKLSEEHKQKLRSHLIGRKVSDEQKLKCSLSNIKTKSKNKLPPEVIKSNRRNYYLRTNGSKRQRKYSSKNPRQLQLL